MSTINTLLNRISEPFNIRQKFGESTIQALKEKEPTIPDSRKFLFYPGFANVLLDIVTYLKNITTREEGGFVMTKAEGHLVQFVRVKNGVPYPRCVSLYEPEDEGMGDVFDLQDNGWVIGATVHNHPKWDAIPSVTDLSCLFQSCAVNLIYSNPKQRMSAFSSDGATIHTWSDLNKGA